MPSLTFSVTGADVQKHAATPSLALHVRIRQIGMPLPIQSISLQCQLRIDARRRAYLPEDQEKLGDLFGEPERWSQTLTSLLWQHAGVIVPPFDGETCDVDLVVPCSFDFNVAATKYFYGVSDGQAPLLLLFSGSVFYRDEDGRLAMDLISWTEEARFPLPFAAWRNMMDHYYPNQAWLCLNRRAFDALYEYKRRHGYTGFDEAVTALLANESRAVAS